MKLPYKTRARRYLLLEYLGQSEGEGCGDFGLDKNAFLLDQQLEFASYKENIPSILDELPGYNETL